REEEKGHQKKTHGKEKTSKKESGEKGAKEKSQEGRQKASQEKGQEAPLRAILAASASRSRQNQTAPVRARFLLFCRRSNVSNASAPPRITRLSSSGVVFAPKDLCNGLEHMNHPPPAFLVLRTA